MKTKTIEIKPEFKDWGVRENDCMIEVFIGRNVYDLIRDQQIGTKVTLTLEIPTPEPKLEITPSDIDKVFEEWNSARESFHDLSNFVKEKLFGVL